MHPTIVLRNGLCVANFSSPHTFAFTTGEVLPACSPEMSRSLVVTQEEIEIEKASQKWTDIELGIIMPATTWAALEAVALRPDIDVVLVPFMVAEAAAQYRRLHLYDVIAGQPFAESAGLKAILRKVRVTRSCDRVTKEVFPDKFCSSFGDATL